MFAANDERKKLYSNEPVASIFDAPAVGRALSMRSSSNYPGSIVDQLRSSRKSFGTCQVVASTGRHIAGMSVVPSGDQSDSSSDSDTDDANDRRLPSVSLMPETDADGSGSKGVEGSSPTVFDTQTGSPQVDETVLQRQQKKDEILSSTDTESDNELSTFGSVSKSKMPLSKSRKRRKRLTANLAGTRYDVGKSLSFLVER